MKTLFLLLLSTLSLTAQTTNVWLFCSSYEKATNAIATLDAALGYPNPATLTETACKPLAHPTNTNWFLVVLEAPIYSPKEKRYSLPVNTFPKATLSDKPIDKLPPQANITTIMVTKDAAKAAGFELE